MIELLTGFLIGVVALTDQGKEMANKAINNTMKLGAKLGKGVLVETGIWVDDEKSEESPEITEHTIQSKNE